MGKRVLLAGSIVCVAALVANAAPLRLAHVGEPMQVLTEGLREVHVTDEDATSCGLAGVTLARDAWVVSSRLLNEDSASFESVTVRGEKSPVAVVAYDEERLKVPLVLYVDLVGKGGHIRTVPVPDWVKVAIDRWVGAADLTAGRLFRCVCRAGKCWGDRVTERVVWHVVKDYAKRLGLSQVAPHDLRRSCAKLCHAAGGELEQIQFLLGHTSIQTTERYLGCKQNSIMRSTTTSV